MQISAFRIDIFSAAGTASSISGSSVTYAAGGSGGSYIGGASGTAGTANTGGTVTSSGGFTMHTFTSNGNSVY